MKFHISLHIKDIKCSSNSHFFSKENGYSQLANVKTECFQSLYFCLLYVFDTDDDFILLASISIERIETTSKLAFKVQNRQIVVSFLFPKSKSNSVVWVHPSLTFSAIFHFSVKFFQCVYSVPNVKRMIIFPKSANFTKQKLQFIDQF